MYAGCLLVWEDTLFCLQRQMRCENAAADSLVCECGLSVLRVRTLGPVSADSRLRDCALAERTICPTECRRPSGGFRQRQNVGA